MVKKNFLKSSLIVLVAIAMILPVIPTISLATSDKPSITYSAHMQTYGWDKVNQKPGDALGEAKVFAGVTGESKRMEALEVNMAPMTGVTLEYRAHVQGKGWMDWTKVDDRAGHTATVGTTGESKRVEALQLSVKGLTNYSILYRAHVQGEGWMDWVDAADPTAYAGTEGRSLRMEAFEIVVLPKNEFYYLNNHNGTHTSSYNGKLGETEECVFGDYTVSGDQMTRQCALCGYSNGEKVSLQDLLTEAKLDGQSKVTLEKVTVGDEGLTIPEGMTLEVEDELDTNSKAVVVNGHLVVKTIADPDTANVTFGENGVVTLSGVYDTETNGLENNLKFATRENVNVDKIIMEEGSTDQTLGTETVEVSDDKELVLDLNGTKVESSVEASNDAIINNGKLTINDGIIDVKASDGIRSFGNKSELVVNNCTIKGNAERAISIGENNAEESTKQVATITNTTIETKGTENDSYAVAVFGDEAKVTMKDVKINVASNGIYTNGHFKDINFVAERVTVNSEATAVYFAAAGEYTFTNSTIKGLDGIEYTGGKLTLNNTNVEATRKNITPGKITLTGNGNGTLVNALEGNGEDELGAGVMLKVNNGYASATGKSELNITGSSKITSEYGPAILVASDVEEFESSNVGLHYPSNAVTGYTKVSNITDSVVWAEYSAD